MDEPTSVAAARGCRELRRFELRRLRIPVGGEVIPLVVPDAAALRRQGEWVEGLRGGGEPPYWSRIWRSAVAVGRLLSRWPRLDGVEVCDLGCGLGLPGLVAARGGARVTFVDRQAEALAFASWNAAATGGSQVRCVACDWRVGSLQGSFGLMILADVSYAVADHEPLKRLIEASLAEDGLVVHADPVREASSAFLRALAERLAVACCVRRVSLPTDGGVVRVCLAARSERRLGEQLERLTGDWGWTAGVLP